MPTLWQRLFGMKAGANVSNDLSSVLSNPLVQILASKSTQVGQAVGMLGTLQQVASIPIDDAPPAGGEPSITFTLTEWNKFVAANNTAVNKLVTQLGAPVSDDAQIDAIYDAALTAEMEAAGFDLPADVVATAGAGANPT